MATALITGATAGIGEATARLFSKNNFELILLGRREDRLKKLQGELEGKVHTFSLDLRHRPSVEKWMESQSTLLSRVDVLVNNAGLAQGVDLLQDSKVEDWEDMIDTNIKGLLYLTRGILPHLIRGNRGHIVNLGSVAGRIVYPRGAVYCATKFAVRALSEGLRMDLMGTPIRVTNIEPGMVDTEFSVVRLKSEEKARAVYEGMDPLKAQDIAETILWCVQRPAHVNIQELVIYPTDQAGVGLVHRHEKGKS